MAGDVITKINGVKVLEVEHINQLLNKKEGQEVRLSLKTQSGREIEQIVKPIGMSAEADLRYSEWEHSRRVQVESKTDNKVGYLHLRAMGGGNFDEFVKGYYPVFDREGLIIDVRNNRGWQHRQLDIEPLGSQGLVLLAVTCRKTLLEHAVRLQGATSWCFAMKTPLPMVKLLPKVSSA